MTNLKEPLCQNQIDAAGRLWKNLRQWQTSEAALLLLSKRFPDFEPEVCLLKSVSVNAIYTTNVLAIVQMANHVADVLGRHNRLQAGAELVRRIANVPAEKGQPSRIHTSFASKFCHFFIDADRFPIYDNAARDALKLHFERHVEAHDYGAFCSYIAELKNEVGRGCDTRRIDHYLWLTGMYKRWLRERLKEHPIVNAELLDLFKNPSEVQRATLDAMLPTKLERVFKGES